MRYGRSRVEMKVAIPIWQGHVSPVFDSAQQLLIVEIADSAEIRRSEEKLPQGFPPQCVARLKQLGVDVLVCGAISRPLAGMIAASGITLVPFISGECEEVLAAYLDKKLPSPQFLMPGCYGSGPGRRHRRHHRGGGGRDMGRGRGYGSW